MGRKDGRTPDQLRPVTITLGWQETAFASALVELGRTKVVCAVSYEDRVPPFLRGSGKGWVTSEYAMLPGATGERSGREVSKGRPGGRTHEIQRLIGRSLRAVTDTKAFGESTLWVDCDVLQADGGTRCASITGAWVALFAACHRLQQEKRVKSFPLRDHVAAVSVGMVDGTPCLDLHYEEDVRAETDMNVVMTGLGGLVEVQGTAEREPFSRAELDALLDLAATGIASLVRAQKQALGQAAGGGVDPGPAAASPSARPPSTSATAAPASGPARRLLLASANRGKLRELRAILEGLPVELVGLDDAGAGEPPEVEETGDTFLENALLKARAYAAWSGLAAVADDSGLEVDALGGAPGVRSARYAGQGASDQANLDKLLAELTGVPPERRTARFRCTAVLVDPGWRVRGGVARRGGLGGAAAGRAQGHRGVRLRPGVRPRRLGPDQRRGRPGDQGRRLPPRQGLPRPAPGHRGLGRPAAGH